jgi:hypothetical protein
MISRRTFLIYTTLTPLIMSGGDLQALSVENSVSMAESNNHLEENLQSMDFAIEGWYANDCDVSNARIISLSTSWKSDWL